MNLSGFNLCFLDLRNFALVLVIDSADLNFCAPLGLTFWSEVLAPSGLVPGSGDFREMTEILEKIFRT